MTPSRNSLCLRSHFATYLAAFSACLLCIAANAASLESLRATYEKGLKKLDGDCSATLKEEFSKYGKSLKSLSDTLRQQGDLDGLIAAKAETTRFDSEKTVPKAEEGAAPAIAKIRTSYHARRSAARIKKNNGIISFTQKYIAALDNQKKALTKQNRIEQALAFKAEVDRVNESGVVNAAEFELAEEGYGRVEDHPGEDA